MEKIDQLTSFANHLSKGYSYDLHTLSNNINNTKNLIEKLSGTNEIRLLLQTEIYHAQQLITTLRTIETSISPAWREITNLELITFTELIQIHDHLKQTYSEDQLLPTDETHSYKLFQISKLVVIGTNNTITFLLKLPIIKALTVNYSRIYPLPNHQEIILVPPKDYYIEAGPDAYLTAEQCRLMDSFALCLQTTLIPANCTLPTLTQCPTARISNNYQIFVPLRARRARCN